MVVLRKNKEIQTIYPGLYYIIRATPADALPGDREKNFFIVDEVDRNPKDGRVYSVSMTTKDRGELREALGMKKREVLKFSD